MALSTKIQLQIYEMNKQGYSPIYISNKLQMDILVVKKCIKQMGIPKKNECIELKNPEQFYAYLNEKALNISKEEAERRAVIHFKMSFNTFNHYYNTWRKNYLNNFSVYTPEPENIELYAEEEEESTDFY